MATKKLIEVALPLEKNQRGIGAGKVHPSRPPVHPASVVGQTAFGGGSGGHLVQVWWMTRLLTRSCSPRRRNRIGSVSALFRILEDLVVWENSNNEQVLEAAKTEIMKSTGGNPRSC